MSNYKPIKSYDVNSTKTHIIRFTLMYEGFTGTVSVPVGGNCHGADLLEPDFLADAEESFIVENDCNFTYVGDNYFTATLHDDDGNECLIEDMFEDIADMIVGMQFVEKED